MTINKLHQVIKIICWFNSQLIKLMHRSLTNKERVEQNRHYFQKLIQEVKPRAFILNVKLANNPFLKSQDKFQYVVYHLNEYNKRIEKISVTDPYEMLSYQKLHSMISDLAQIETRQDQVQALGEVFEWYKEQSRLVEQRRNQGEIRYEMTKNYRDFKEIDKIRSEIPKEPVQEKPEPQIPTQLVARIMEPYYFGNRTRHADLQIPLRRLNQYKRKVINIAPFIDTKETQKPSRVLYPMPPKYEPKEEEEEPKQGEEGQQNKEGAVEGQPPAEGQQGQPPAQGQQNNAQNPGQPEQDLGGFGEQPQEPQQEEPPEDAQDKLAPKHKIFTAAVANITANQKAYKGQYMHYRGRQQTSERSLEMRYLKLQEQILNEQRQDKINIQLAGERARKKSKMMKDIQKKLEDMMHKPNYKFSLEDAPPQEKLSKEDEVRFGFTMNLRPKPKYAEIDVGNQTAFLPKIKDDSFQEKTIRRDRIQSLKSKFSKLLNLSEYEERQTAPSMCQYSARKRGFSEIIRAHSKSKERLNQLDEVTRIKQKLTRNKIGVNIRALSQGLCLPDSEQNSSEPPEHMFANKELPSNPFMVETKKKKKKKK